jgi:hypothetical protein
MYILAWLNIKIAHDHYAQVLCIEFSNDFINVLLKNSSSVAFSPQTIYTVWVAAACQRS